MEMKETVYKIPGLKDLTIALIADFHNTDPTAIISSLSTHHPDLICISGDFLVGYRPKDDGLIVQSQENVVPFFRACAGLEPTYISLGNHEWMISEEDVNLIQSTGAVVLDNEWCMWNGIAVGGLTSAIVSDYQKFRLSSEERYPYRERRPHTSSLAPELDWIDEFEAAPGYKVLLCHHPEYYPRFLINKNIDLILSGHAHGGQWRIMGQGLYAPGQGWLPKYTSGVYDGRLIVSRGLSNTAGIPRLFNPTEVVYVQISPDSDKREKR